MLLKRIVFEKYAKEKYMTAYPEHRKKDLLNQHHSIDNAKAMNFDITVDRPINTSVGLNTFNHTFPFVVLYY